MRRFGLIAIYFVVSLNVFSSNPTLALAGEHDEILKLTNQLEALNEAGRYPEVELVARQIVARGERYYANHPPNLAICLGYLANALNRQAKYKESIPLNERRLKLVTQSLDAQHPGLSNVMDDLATSYLAVSRFEDAELLYRRALSIREKAFGVQDPKVAIILNGLGRVYLELTRYSEAEAMFNRALAIETNAFGEESLKLIPSLNHLAMAFREQDRFREAELYAVRALAISEKLRGPDHPIIAEQALTLATIYFHQGQYAQAESLYRRTLSIRAKAYGENDALQTVALGNLVSLLIQQRRTSEAESLTRHCLAIEEKAFGDQHPRVAKSLVILAGLYLDEGRFAEAEPMLIRALTIQETALGDQHFQLLNTLLNLGVLHKNLGAPAKAEAFFQRALTIAETSLGKQHHLVSGCLHKMAWLSAEQGRFAESENYIGRAIVIDDQAAVGPDMRFQRYFFRASVRWHLDRKEESLDDMRQALDLAEQARHQISGADVERAESFARYATAFEQMVAFQLIIGKTTEALQTMERGRARSLLDEMNRVGFDLNFGLSPKERQAVKDKESQIKSRIAQFEKQLEKAPESEKEKFKLASSQARKELYEQYRDERNNSPVYRNLLSNGSGPPQINQLKQTFVANDGLALAYLFGKHTGYVIVLDSQEPRSFNLNVDEIQAKALETSAGPLTNDRLQEILIGKDNSGIVPQLATTPTDIKPENLKRLTARLAALWQVLIPESERVALTSGQCKQLIVVPDGPLALFPFESLVVQGEQDPEYLLDRGPSILYGPSLSVLYNLSMRSKVPQAGKPVLTVADPVYPRESQVASAQGASLVELASRNRYSGVGGQLSRLPFTAEESNVVRDVFTNVGLVASSLMREQATEANVRQSVADRKIVHLACHGLTDQAYGNFFGALALTPGQKSQADSTDDGFLTLPEIYELNMKGCELAILSACQTNYGPQQKGEGVWAISRGFLVGGARRVVASNWLVNDEAGARLIQYYCMALADDEKQSRPADYAKQLQAAKKWVRSQPNWRHPYFWSTFVLVGPP
jgi:CHAT domain-containing protein/Tfp pilus assembly protein PilF